MQIHIITLFPEMFDALNHSIIRRAQQLKRVQLHFWNPRNFASPPHRQVDDRPFGGGPGMVLQVEPLQLAVQAARKVTQSPLVIYFSPQGIPLTQDLLKQQTQYSELILVAGRYEGVDERFIDLEVDQTYSIGDFVVSGGELPAMLYIDAVTRLLPGVLGHPDSILEESFNNDLLDYPHYTRPANYQGLKVPEVLLSGHHDAIKRWRLKQSLGKTWQMRKDLLKRRVLTREEQELLQEYIEEQAHTDH
jgi:tRNA (guanine37-N1)-methyltransferase